VSLSARRLVVYSRWRGGGAYLREHRYHFLRPPRKNHSLYFTLFMDFIDSWLQPRTRLRRAAGRSSAPRDERGEEEKLPPVEVSGGGTTFATAVFPAPPPLGHGAAGYR